MTIKILFSSLLTLAITSAIAGNAYVYESKNGQTLLTNTSKPSGSFEQYNKKVKTTYYKNGSLVTNHSSYANSAYAALDSSTGNYDSNDNIQRVIKPMKDFRSINGVSNQASSEFEVPDGYRLPTKTDNFDDWKTFNAPNHLKADFNSDGIEDEAYILPRKGSKLGYGVFVSLNKANAGIQSGRKFQIFKLTARDDMQPQSFAIELAEPSNEIWETACGKGYWECELGEPAEVKITNPSIMFCYIESSCTMFLWDTGKLSFKEIQFSD